MDVKTIIKKIKKADSIQGINDTLHAATIFEYVKENINDKYDYRLIKADVENHQPARCVDLDGNPVPLADLKDAILANIF